MSHLDKAIFFKSGQTKRLESIVTTTHKSHSTQVKQYPVHRDRKIEVTTVTDQEYKFFNP